MRIEESISIRGIISVKTPEGRTIELASLSAQIDENYGNMATYVQPIDKEAMAKYPNEFLEGYLNFEQKKCARAIQCGWLVFESLAQTLPTKQVVINDK